MADPSPAPSAFLDYLSKWSPVFLLLLGGLATQLWNRYRGRTRRFIYKVLHTQVAIAANHPILGIVTVQHNGRPVNHVHVTTVEFVNDSNEDANDIELTLSFGPLGHIVNSTGSIQGVLGFIPFDTAYVAQYANATPQQINNLNTSVVHRIAVLNRRQTATFVLFVIRDDATPPVLTASCNHPGFRLEFVPSNVAQINGVPFNVAVGMGFIVSLVVVILLVWKSHHPSTNVVVAWLMGIYIARIGSDVIRAMKAVERILG